MSAPSGISARALSSVVHCTRPWSCPSTPSSMLALLATTTTPHSAMLCPLYLVEAPSPELYKMS